MGYLHAIKTDDGNVLLSRVMAGETKIMFTKLTISDKTIDEYEIKQEIVASSEKFVDSGETGVVLTAVFRNTNMTEGYYIQTIGVYAKDDDGNEVMFSYLPADDNPLYLEADNGQVPQLINVRVETGIHLADDSVILINPDGVATIEYVNTKVTEINDKLETLNGVSATLLVTTDGWATHTDSSGKNYYSHSFTLTGLKSTNVPIIALKPDDTINVAIVKAKKKAYRSLIGYECSNNSILIYSQKIPTTAFTIELKGVGI